MFSRFLQKRGFISPLSALFLCRYTDLFVEGEGLTLSPSFEVVDRLDDFVDSDRWFDELDDVFHGLVGHGGFIYGFFVDGCREDAVHGFCERFHSEVLSSLSAGHDSACSVRS